jgi:hypothetical protein
MRRIARTVAAGIVVILGLALVAVSAVGANNAGPLGRPAVPDDDKVQVVPPFNPERSKEAAIPQSMRPNSFASEYGKRSKHKVEVRVTGGAVFLITFRNDKEGEWGQGSVTRSRTVNSGFPVVQVAMQATRGIHSTCVVTIDGEEKDTQSTSAETPLQFCEA